MAKYEVHGMTLIPQMMTMSCWYASARMLIQWQMERCQQPFSDLVPPELDEQCRKIRDGNTGIVNGEIVRMAKRLGLLQDPPATPTLEYWNRC